MRNKEAISSTGNMVSSLKVFLRPTLSKVEYSSGYLLFISHSTICFWTD